MLAEPYDMRAVLTVVLFADIPAYYLVFHRQVAGCCCFMGGNLGHFDIFAFEVAPHLRGQGHPLSHSCGLSFRLLVSCLPACPPTPNKCTTLLGGWAYPTL